MEEVRKGAPLSEDEAPEPAVASAAAAEEDEAGR